MPKSPASTGGRRRAASPEPIGDLPEPPEALSIQPAIDNLRLRLDYVHDVLGLRIELVALLARLSHKALRFYRSEKWNPSLSTLLQVDQTLQKHMSTWIQEKRDTKAS